MAIPKSVEAHNIAETLEKLRAKVLEIGEQGKADEQEGELLRARLGSELQATRQVVVNRYNQAIENARAAHSTACAVTNREIERLETQRRLQVDQLITATDEWNHLSSFARRSQKRKEEHETKVSALQKAIAQTDERLEQEKNSLLLICQRLSDQKAAAEKEKLDSLANLDSQGRERVMALNRQLGGRRERLEAASIQALHHLLPSGLLLALDEAREVAAINIEQYTPPVIDEYERPGLFYLGSFRSTSIGEESLGTRLAQENITYSDTIIGSGARLQFRAPAIVDLSQGFRLIMTSKRSRDYVDRFIRNLALKLLLSYPLTRVQLAMIDPQKNGQTFTGLPGLVDRAHESIINGSVRVSERDIEELMSALLARQKGYNTSYGPGKRDEYFLKEAVQAVFINDFPNGFTKAALGDLAKLMEGGAAYGMVFIIGVNEEHAKRLKGDADYGRVMNDPDAWYVDIPSGQCRGREVALDIDDESERILTMGDRLLDNLRTNISNATGRIERFESLHPDLDDSNSWCRNSSLDGLKLAIGISGAQGSAFVTFGRSGADVRHHGLVAGPTGAGKTNLLHILIMSALLDYKADDLQFVLIDFKEGVEFRQYAGRGIPSLRSITVSTQPEFALAALRDVEEEYKHRMALGMSNYQAYRNGHPNEFLPRLIVVFDEVQSLFRPDVRPEIRSECARILKLLVEQGRAGGIHIVLASQSFSDISEVHSMLVNMAVRVVVKDAGDGGILSEASELEDSPQGYAILNDKRGENAAFNQLIQVPKLEEQEHEKLLNRLTNKYEEFLPHLLARFGSASLRTRLLFENVEDDPNHPFTLIADSFDNDMPLELNCWHDETPRIILGSILSAPGRENPYTLAGGRYELDMYENLLLVGRDSTIAAKVFIEIVLSTCLDNLCRTDGDAHEPVRDRVIVMNFGESSNLASLETRQNEDADVKHVSLDCIYEFGHVEHVSTAQGGRRRRRSQEPVKSKVELVIEELYDLLQKRKAQFKDDQEVVFDDVVVLMYGFDNAAVFTNASIHDLGAGMTSIERLRALLSEGVDYDIFFAVWSQSLMAVDHILGYGDGSLTALMAFGRRMAFTCSKEDLMALTNLDEYPATSQGVAFYDTTSSDRLYLCPYALPRLEWFEKFREVYEANLKKVRGADDEQVDGV